LRAFRSFSRRRPTSSSGTAARCRRARRRPGAWELLPRMFGPEIVAAFREFKSIWDPRGRMNPGKVVDPLPLDADLRPALTLADPATIFGFAADGGSLSRALARCVGVGKCRRESGGAMCRHTRPRTRNATPPAAAPGFYGRCSRARPSPTCGAAKSGRGAGPVHRLQELQNDCPVQVDIATYKAEFMAHHYAGRIRPASPTRWD